MSSTRCNKRHFCSISRNRHPLPPLLDNSTTPVLVHAHPQVLSQTIKNFRAKVPVLHPPNRRSQITALVLGFVSTLRHNDRAVDVGSKRGHQRGLQQSQRVHRRPGHQVRSGVCVRCVSSPSHPPPPSPPFMYPATTPCNPKYKSCLYPPPSQGGTLPPPNQLGRTQIIIVSDPLASIYK